ncbi:dihydrofolate reductase [Dendryphion nanum]|uniref:Dihydrofolate reductase n=1 Tax=Dendryphion nanum TaxID=256645 RepID=A0A9P9INU0_9PLEO|nr:dihydrofolate reductase [Dendryphion nanum]
MSSVAPTPSRPLKILMLHGYTQSGPLFHAKTRALEKNLQKSFPAGISLHYPTAPRRLSPADVPFLQPAAKDSDTNGVQEEPEEVDAWGWWQRKGDSIPYEYEGLEDGFGHIAQLLKSEGPFDGVIGFSQGGAATGMVASLLEPNRRAAFEKLYPEGGMLYPDSFSTKTGDTEEPIHPPLKFAVSYSGFAAQDSSLYKAFYEPKIQTPMLHFIGSLDTVVDEKRSLALVEACETSEGRVVYHPGGHFLPSSQKVYVQALIGFIKERIHIAEQEGKSNGKEESVEDMDVPF